MDELAQLSRSGWHPVDVEAVCLTAMATWHAVPISQSDSSNSVTSVAGEWLHPRWVRTEPVPMVSRADRHGPAHRPYACRVHSGSPLQADDPAGSVVHGFRLASGSGPDGEDGPGDVSRSSAGLAGREIPPGQRLVRSLRRRPRLRAGLVQLAYVGGAVGAAIVTADIQAGPQVDAARTSNLLFAVGGGIISLVAVVFSLLFLTVQFASTTLSPRLNLFRDEPLVWHAFGLFVGVFVFATTAALRTSTREEMSVVIPVATIVLALAAMAVARNLQMSAFSSVQVGPTVQEITRRGRAVIDQLYELRTAETVAPSIPFEARSEVRWPGDDGYIRQVDVQRLFDSAIQHQSTIELPLRPGQYVRHGDVVLRHTIDPAGATGDDLLRHIEIGPDRTWEQDPLLAFRLLVDIGLRAQSPAINDPATCRHTIDAISGLLRYLADRHLTIGDITDRGSHARLVLRAVTWEDYVAAAVDELIEAGRSTPSVAARLVDVLDGLTLSVPVDRRHEIEQRLRVLA